MAGPDRDRSNPDSRRFRPDLPPTSPRSRRASRPHGRRAITPSSARRCRSSARNCARRSISRPARRCSMSPPATAWRASPRRGAGATSPRPTTCRRCWSAAGRARRRKAGRSSSAEADAENLPFDDNSFDTVLSTFGVMFTPNQERAAAELMRVCRPGGQIGLANWTPDGFIGQVFKTLGKYLPPPAGAQIAGAVGHARAAERIVRRMARARSARNRGCSSSATARRRTSSTCSRPITARC